MTQPIATSESKPPPRFCRVRDIMAEWGVSKPWVFAQLKAGRLRGRKLGGVLLIERESLDEFLALAEPWKPMRE